MRILLTGSSGQLGREIARQLADTHAVIGLDILPGTYTNHLGSTTDRDTIYALVRQVDAIIHTASLHAPHVEQKSKQEFIETNMLGTLHLLEAAAEAQIRRFVYTSTTSVYGFALVPTDRAVWVTEELTPRPRDIYDITKLGAEALCQHFALAQGVPVIVLRTSRFYAEDALHMAIHRLYRGADVRDIAAAHALALTNQDIQYDVFNISARSPFAPADLSALLHDAPLVIRRYFPDAEQVFRQHGWQLPQSIDRVYVTDKAERALGYQPRFNFAAHLEALRLM